MLKVQNSVKINDSAPEKYFPSHYGATCAVRCVENEQQAIACGEAVGTILWLIEIENGDALEIPEQYLTKIFFTFFDLIGETIDSITINNEILVLNFNSQILKVYSCVYLKSDNNLIPIDCNFSSEILSSICGQAVDAVNLIQNNEIEIVLSSQIKLITKYDAERKNFTFTTNNNV